MIDLIKQFQLIRDIPYSIPLSLQDINNSCSGKCIALKALCTISGYKAKYRVCTFKRSDLPLPKELLDIPHEDESLHVYLELEHNGNIIKVDPTRDLGLKNIFEISGRDGVNDTPIAVNPIKLFDYEKSSTIMEHTSDQEILDDLKINGVFYRGLNQRLEELRNQTD